MHWQLPPGVSPGTWDYVRSRTIAADYDQFLQDDPLTRFDWRLVQHYLPHVPPSDSPQSVVEFGCGNGRTLLPLIRSGYRAVGVDLSTPMLLEMRRKFEEEKKIAKAAVTAVQQPTLQPLATRPPETRLPPAVDVEPSSDPLVSLRANLVQLDGLASNSVDHGVCLFSTLGMIRGHEHRAKFLRHCHRIIRRDGWFILHAHHLWNQLLHPGGKRWLAEHAWQVIRGREELGDRFASYRGVQNMFIHSFRKRELKRLLADSRFDPQHWHPFIPTAKESASPEGGSSRRGVVGWVIACRCVK